jgi:hypothetical protein
MPFSHTSLPAAFQIETQLQMFLRSKWNWRGIFYIVLAIEEFIL